MRLHRNLVFAVLENLKDIFKRGAHAEKTISKSLKKDKRWGAKDRDFIAATTYEIIRYRRLYNAIAATKNHFTTENLWKIFSVWAVLRGIELPDWEYFKHTPQRKIKGKFDSLQKIRVFRESIADWMDELCVAELGAKIWDREIKHLNQPAQLVLRANTLKISVLELQKILAEENINTYRDENYPYALILEQRKNVLLTKAFREGFFEIQDACSQLVADYLDVKKGMRVVDACAGGGGKTLHLAALMENKGQIIALEVRKEKLKELKKRIRKAGVHNTRIKYVEDARAIRKLHNSADRVLIDAPCSGLGVLKRKPDSKWKLNPQFIKEIQSKQKNILQNYAPLLKKGGKMVYATCSILPSENEKQVQLFLKNNPDFVMEKQQTLYPSQTGFDGFYMALLLKK